MPELISYFGERTGQHGWRVRKRVDTGDGPFQFAALDQRQDLRNHSPDGFAWGYGGSGPAQLALAIVADFTGDDDRALSIYQTFKDRVIAKLSQDKGFEITGPYVAAEIERCEADG